MSQSMSMSTKANWATALPAYLAEQPSGRLPARRALRKFSEWCMERGYGDAYEGDGFAAARALGECADAISAASPDRVAALETEADLAELRYAYRAQLKADEAARIDGMWRRLNDLRASDEQCLLIAGESSKIVMRGTYEQCENGLACLSGLPTYAGTGAWVIVRAADGEEVDSGWFAAGGRWWR